MYERKNNDSLNLSPMTLEGPTIRLEPLRREHLDGLCAVGLDPELWRWTTYRIQKRADLVHYVETARIEQQAGLASAFVTIRRTNGDIIGSTRFGSLMPIERRVEIGWTWLARPWQRSGANTETKYLMLRHAFDHWGCRRVEFRASAFNDESRNAPRRIGVVEEGVLRQHMLWDEDRAGEPEVRDTVYYSIIAEEWPSVKARLVRLMASRGIRVEN